MSSKAKDAVSAAAPSKDSKPNTNLTATKK